MTPIPQMASLYSPDVIIVSDDEDELSNTSLPSSPSWLQTAEHLYFLETSDDTDIQLNGSPVHLKTTCCSGIPNFDSSLASSTPNVTSHNSQTEPERVDVIVIDDSEDSDCPSSSSADSPLSSPIYIQTARHLNFLEASGDTDTQLNGSAVNLTITPSRKIPGAGSCLARSAPNTTSHFSQTEPKRMDVIVIDDSEDSDCSNSSSADSPYSFGPWLNSQPSAIDLDFMKTSSNPETIERELTQTATNNHSSVRQPFDETSTRQQPGGDAVINVTSSQKKRTKQQYSRAKTPEDFWSIGCPDSKTDDIGSSASDSNEVSSPRRRKPLIKMFSSKTEEEEEEKKQDEARKNQYRILKRPSI